MNAHRPGVLPPGPATLVSDGEDIRSRLLAALGLILASVLLVAPLVVLALMGLIGKELLPSLIAGGLLLWALAMWMTIRLVDQLLFPPLLEDVGPIAALTGHPRSRAIARAQARADVAQRLTEVDDEEALLDALVHYADRWLDSEFLIASLDPDGHTLVTRRHARAMIPAGSAPPPDDALWPLAVGPFAAGEPIICDDLHEDVRLDPTLRAAHLAAGVRSLAILPLIDRATFLGAIALLSPTPGGATRERTLDRLDALATQGAASLRAAHQLGDARRTAERLREVDRLKSEFLANMSHELRTPLNSIIGYAELLMMSVRSIEAFDDEMQLDLNAIYLNGQQLLDLINDLLDLAKIEAGRMELLLEPLDIGLILDEVRINSLGLVHRLRRDLTLTVDADPELPPLLGDSIRLRQILNNLVSNAIKFTEEGDVRLRARRDGLLIRVEVEDTGIGIAPERQETIFDKFGQVDEAPRSELGGTGLGLAIASHLVRMHGGRLEVRSRPGIGSIFYFSVPCCNPAAAPRIVTTATIEA